MDVWWGPYLKVADHFLFMEFEKSNPNILGLLPQNSIGPRPMITIWTLNPLPTEIISHT